jgi:hypothetical protein
MRDIPGEVGDELRMRRTDQVCGLHRQPAAHQLANCRTNAFSLSHGASVAWVKGGARGKERFVTHNGLH